MTDSTAGVIVSIEKAFRDWRVRSGAGTVGSSRRPFRVGVLGENDVRAVLIANVGVNFMNEAIGPLHGDIVAACIFDNGLDDAAVLKVNLDALALVHVLRSFVVSVLLIVTLFMALFA